MVYRSKLRREPITCVGCGLDIPLKDIRKHDNDYCANRYVPCRNWALGCQVMVRLQERAKHEYVDGKVLILICICCSSSSSSCSFICVWYSVHSI